MKKIGKKFKKKEPHQEKKTHLEGSFHSWFLI